MAIAKVGVLTDPPEAGDWTRLMAHISAYTKQLGNQSMILTEWTNTTGTPAVALGSYIGHGGVLYVVSSEEAVTLPGDGTYYLKVVASGDTLILSWISSLSGYAWNAVYNGLYHADESQILPYMLVVASAVVEKWKITNLMQGSGFASVRYDGAVKCTSINTGGLGNFLIGQNLRTTDSPTFDIPEVTTITLKDDYVVGDTVYINNTVIDSGGIPGTDGEVVIFEYQIKASGAFRIKTNIEAYSSSGSNPVTTEKIYVNDIVIATNVTTTQNTTEAKVNDISLQNGDVLKISIQCSVTNATSWCYFVKPTSICVSFLNTSYLGYSIQNVEQAMFGALIYP